MMKYYLINAEGSDVWIEDFDTLGDINKYLEEHKFNEDVKRTVIYGEELPIQHKIFVEVELR